MATENVRVVNSGGSTDWFEIANADFDEVMVYVDGNVKLQFAATKPSSVNVNLQPVWDANTPRVRITNPRETLWILLESGQAAIVVRGDTSFTRF